MSGKLSPLKGEALHAARCAERKRIMEERADKATRVTRSVGEKVEVTWSGNTKPLSTAITPEKTTGNSAPFDVSKIETLLAADYVRNTLDMTDKPDTQE